MNDWEYPTEDNILDEASTGSNLDGPAWVQRLVARLGNVRIHDTAQAGELAARLGARGFTIGRDVYVRPDLMRPATAQSMGLLAHELFHVGEQAGIDMPLMTRSVGGTRAGGNGSTGHGSLNVQRAPAANTVPASQSGSEIAAEAIESAVVRQGVGANANEQQGGSEPPSPEAIADKVYGLIARDLMLDRERAAYGW